MNQTRVRIAPSPTGYLHIGTARTALFNYLFAKKNDGKFILRVEDTDLERSEEIYLQNIYDSLKAIGLNWDEGPNVGGNFGPYVQSERLELYKSRAQELIDKGHAYYCYCTQDELDHEKEQAAIEKKLYLYSGKCVNISEELKQKYISEGRQPTIRFKVPQQDIILQDMIRGEVSFSWPLIGDFVIIKSNGTPTYNFAVVVDDIAMEITHVIRGEDHISNTPRQIMLYNAFNKPLPFFAHVGMILAPDKTKLSKRHGATAVSDFIEQGYLPEALVNFLALLGWSSPDGEEVKSLSEIISLFELERISHSPAIFDKEKLNWLNGVYIRNLPVEEVTNRCKKYLNNYDLSCYSEEKLQVMISAIRERLTTLKDVTEAASCFFGRNIIIEEQTQQEALTGDHVKDVLEKFINLAEELNFNNVEELEEQLTAFRKSLKPLKPKLVMWPIRAALTGQTHGIDLGICIYLLGKDLVQFRITEALKKLPLPKMA